MSDLVYLDSVANEKGISVQAVHQFLKRKGVQPYRRGTGWGSSCYRKKDVEDAYRKKRSYRKTGDHRNV